MLLCLTYVEPYVHEKNVTFKCWHDCWHECHDPYLQKCVRQLIIPYGFKSKIKCFFYVRLRPWTLSWLWEVFYDDNLIFALLCLLWVKSKFLNNHGNVTKLVTLFSWCVKLLSDCFFASETDRPQVTPRNWSRCRVAAVNAPGQPFCKYPVNSAHKIQEAACG